MDTHDFTCALSHMVANSYFVPGTFILMWVIAQVSCSVIKALQTACILSHSVGFSFNLYMSVWFVLCIWSVILCFYLQMLNKLAAFHISI